MLIQWFSELGPWNWLILGAVLLALEIMTPGVYLMWLGIAAILTGMLSFQFADTLFWGWQAQVVVFLALSVASALIGRYFFPANKADDSDQPLLNQRGQQLVGRTAMLEEPISEGRGRIRLGDTLWPASGPDLPAGTRVRVVSADGSRLEVEPTS
jgi:membrane protein implicated in regulation of membrane protease activity